MSRVQQDQVIDDDEAEACPLCIEEFDLSDRNFRPCPCGFQICQFCFNNIKNVHNGLCPGCRRPYDDKTVQWKQPSAEEVASYRESQAQQQKKKAAARQKEAQKREADTLSRKHLAGIRVRQKNLVYVTGLRPTISEEQLVQALRTDQYFGQYGKIVKIVVSKAKDTQNHPQSVGVYITYARREDAATCIQAVDGTPNGDGKLRAQYGTTKYCSSYLRNETCHNRNCMFLHEPGEENESFTRQDLSSLNVINTQSNADSNTSATSHSHHPPNPPQQAPQPIAAATQPMDRQDSREDHLSSIDSNDGSALPSSASWAIKPSTSRRASQAASAATPSPLVSHSLPLAQVDERMQTSTIAEVPRPQTQSVKAGTSPHGKETDLLLSSLVKTLLVEDLNFCFDESIFSREQLEQWKNYPPLFDANGGSKRHLLKQQEEERRARENANQATIQAASGVSLDEHMEGGSTQLGGEPDDHRDLDAARQQHTIRPPQGDVNANSAFGSRQSPSMDLTASALQGRTALSRQQQQQQYLLQQFKSSGAGLSGPSQGNPSVPSGALGRPGQLDAASAGHMRQASRFSFANDSASASASVKPVANPKLMSQQSSMMPPQAQHPSSANQFFTSGVQGPPPGLKASGTPPVSGGGMFGQGHGFTSAALNYNANPPRRTPNDEMLQDLARNRGGSTGSGQMSDTGKREFMFPSFLNQHSQSSTPVSAPGLLTLPHGPQPGAFQDHGSQKHKKKGKKHKHANTSSSGGGVVDVADPSILQARMHQAGNPGQGYYGSQGQSGLNSMAYGNTGLSRCAEFHGGVGFKADAGRGRVGLSLVMILYIAAAEAFPGDSQSPDAHHAATPFNLRWLATGNAQLERQRHTPPVPPGLARSPSWSAFATPGPFQASRGFMFEEQMVVPGLGVPNRTTPTATATPDKSSGMAHVDAAKERMEFPPTSKIMEPRPKEKPMTMDEDSFPSLPKPITSQLPRDTKKFGSVMKTMDAPSSSVAATATATAQAAHRQSPSNFGPVKMDLAKSETVRKASQVIDSPSSRASVGLDSRPSSAAGPSERSNTPGQTAQDTIDAASSTSRPATPLTSTETSLKRSVQPRTIRVLATPKSETALPAGTTQIMTSAGTSPATKPPSRKPSSASMHAPETPASERVSDNASVTTDSISRANTPPPGKVGAAAAVGKTKSKGQQKKERQERGKGATEGKSGVETSATIVEEAVLHEPIVGRKKKTKKPAPTVIQPKPSAAMSPQPASAKSKGADLSGGGNPAAATESVTPRIAESSTVDNGAAAKEAQAPVQTESRKPEVPPPEPPKTEASKAEAQKAPPAVSPLLAELWASGELNLAAMEFFKSPASLNHRHDVTITDLDNLVPGLKLSERDLATLDAGHAVRFDEGTIASRVMITPARTCVRGLSREMEDFYLSMEQRIGRTRPPVKYTHRRSEALPGPRNESATRAMLKEQILRDVSILLNRPAHTTANVVDPTKPHADEALSYLDQFIFPPLPVTDKSDEAGGMTIGSAIPRIYTTGDPTYSVYGADVNSAKMEMSTLGVELSGAPAVKQALSSVMGAVGVLGAEEAERAMLASRKECESLEKRLVGLMKKNKRLAFGSAQ